MLNPVRLRSAQMCSYILPNHIIGKASKGVRFAHAASGNNQPNAPDKMDQEKEQNPESGEKQSLSGGGYAKRSDEEGFGAVYGGNQSLSNEDQEKIVHGNAPEYDQSKRSS